MRLIQSVSDWQNKKVLLRVDFDVPITDGLIVESFRILKQLPAINYLKTHGARVTLVAHISAVDSFGPLVSQFEQLLNEKIIFTKKLEDINDIDAPITFLENIRSFSGEIENDESFAKELARPFNVYVNNDFAVSHRRHASVVAITKFLPSYAGPLIEQEILNLNKAINTPSEGKIVIMGGAKTETKLPVIKSFLNKSQAILLGGVVANDVLKARGVDIADSVADSNNKELLTGLDVNDRRLVVPMDYVISENKILDIGPKTIEIYTKIISQAKTIIWNGPMGMFEDERFAGGTKAVAQSVAEGAEGTFTIIGGGDTISAVDKLNMLNKFSFVSTGGGAMLDYLAGKTLPGLAALQ